MAKLYRRKHISSVSELNKEQDKIMRTAKRLEGEMLDGIFNPQQLAFTAASGVMSFLGKNKKKKKKNSASCKKESAADTINSFISAKGDSPAPIVNFARNLIANPTVKGIVMGTAKSWLRWQAFNLALFLGKKAYKSIRHKQQTKKLEKELRELNDLSTRR